MKTLKSTSRGKSAVKQKTVSDSPKKTFMNSVEACAYLKIKPQTLYAYVSRGLIRAELRGKGQGHLYRQDDIEALRIRSLARSGHGPVAGAAMRWGEPIMDSAITNIENGMLYYRGHSLSKLLDDDVAFENVAELLWSGELPSMDVRWPPVSSKSNAVKGKTFFLQDSATSIARKLALHVSEVALSDREGHDELLDESLQRARHLIMSTAMELFPPNKLVSKNISVKTKKTIAEIIAERIGISESELAVKAINGSLIASADHELNASTFAARITASTGADLYACILAGVSAFSGRHHGLSPIEVYHFIIGLTSTGESDNYLTHARTKGQAIPGFGHSLYPLGDPRARQLLDRARSVARERGGQAGKHMEIMNSLITAAQKQDSIFPNLDLGLVAIALTLGLSDVGASSLFAVGRMAGWGAHIIEQRQQGFLRPRARYVGRPPVG